MRQVEPTTGLADQKAHRRKEVAARCPHGVKVPGLRDTREEETNGPLLGTCSLCTGTASAFPENAICLFANPEHQEGSTMQCL
jgi:hypothetical protein